jgi:tetratricopeptide (TPR) repeat protein
MENKILVSIPPVVITDATAKIYEAIGLLSPYLIALTPQERHDLPKMSDGTLPFVQKCLDYCQANPEFAPAYVNFGDMAEDMKTYEQLLPIYRMVLQLENKLNDTSMEVGAESYVSALSYYNSVKNAAKYDAPGAKAIYEDLKKRFTKEKAAVPAPENN